MWSKQFALIEDGKFEGNVVHVYQSDPLPETCDKVVAWLLEDQPLPAKKIDAGLGNLCAWVGDLPMWLASMDERGYLKHRAPSAPLGFLAQCREALAALANDTGAPVPPDAAPEYFSRLPFVPGEDFIKQHFQYGKLILQSLRSSCLPSVTFKFSSVAATVALHVLATDDADEVWLRQCRNALACLCAASRILWLSRLWVATSNSA